MTNWALRRREISKASMRATRLLVELQIAVDKPVPVFELVRELRIWLSSRKLSSSFFGFCVRNEASRGICVNSVHPESTQRFTCAHELGHLLLGHEGALDLTPNMSGPPSAVLEEACAQAFASSLLMPVALVYRALRSTGIEEPFDQVRPSHVYSVSRFMDVSYTATIWRLVEMEIIEVHRARQFAKEGAQSAKRDLAGDSNVPNDDLIVVTDPSKSNVVHCRLGDQVRVRNEAAASAGYLWLPAEKLAVAKEARLAWDGGGRLEVASLLTPVSSPPSESTVSALQIGSTEVLLAMVRPWVSREPVRFESLRLDVSARHELDGFDNQQVDGYQATAQIQ
jgi:Zn-dependent peptidase ImmA (M78 family)